MEPLVVTIPHQLGKEEALRRVRPALGKASTSFPVLSARSLPGASWWRTRVFDWR